MIPPLSLSALETGFKAYLDARFAADGVTVPTATAESVVEQAAPVVVCGLSADVLKINAPCVAVVARNAVTNTPGTYDRAGVSVSVVTPVSVPGIGTAAHAALAAIVAALFPARPRAGAPNEDVEAWEDLEAALSETVEAATGYQVGGWYVEAGQAAHSAERVSEAFVVFPGLVHGDLVA